MCGAEAARTLGFLGEYATVAYLEDRRLSMAFRAEDKTAVGGAKAGVWYWREPKASR